MATPPLPPHPGRLAWRVGAVSTMVVGVALTAVALTVDFPKLTGGGFFSDGATYYSLAHSLARDADFEFRREDLVRVWREYPTGPEGIFLKRGRDVQGVRLTSVFPFVALATVPDPDPTRLYYAKSFVFPLAAAPFVRLFGTNGFLMLHALLMTLSFACAYTFLVARSAPAPAMLFAAAFLFASAAPVYMAWLNPDFFNLATVLLAYFCWCYKEARADLGSSAAWWTRVLAGWPSDVLAGILLGVATFSKPTHALLIGPPLALWLSRRQWLRAVGVGGLFALVTAGLFAWNTAITGEWNYQGGEERSTFYSADLDGAGPRLGGFPFLTEQHTFETTGLPRETNRVPVEVLTSRDAVGTVFRLNLGYFAVGRHTGLVPYFFPGALAILLFLVRPRARPLWQWLALAGALASAVFLLLYMPFTYSGGGGPLGNRYFLGVYPVLLFVVPPLSGMAPALTALGVGALFTAQLVVNPFYASVHPGEHTMRGIFRRLPVELTLLNDLPVNLSPSRSRQPLGGVPPLMAYFLDDNAYNREGDAFWVRGESRAELLLRAPVASETGQAGEAVRPLRLRSLDLQLETGAVGNRVSVETGSHTEVVDIPAFDRRTLSVLMAAGVPYKPFPELPTNYVYRASIACQSGFIPLFSVGGRDARFLGVMVRIVPHYE